MRTTDVVVTFTGPSYFTLIAEGRLTGPADPAEDAAPDARTLESEPSRG
jgi:hypothetical protein